MNQNSLNAMEHLLTTEQKMLIESIRAFVAEEILPHEAEADRAGEVPREIGDRIHARAIETGFYAANLPESVGGGGLDNTSMGLLERELGKVSYGLHGYIGRPTELLLECKGEQVERYLAPCVRGDRKECFALTEPGAGSDVMGMRTRAVRDGESYVINGSKHFISSAGEPDFAIVFAATGEEPPRGRGRRPRKQVTAFLVDAGTPGFDLRRGPRCVSQRAYPTYELSFADCRIGAEQMLGGVGEGFALAEKWLKMGRVWVAAACCGKMERLLGLALEWAGSREQFGQTIGRFQGTSFKIADMYTELKAADLMVLDACRKADDGVMQPNDAAAAKLFASEALGRAADHTVQIYGGMGLMESLPVERLWRDARLDRIWDGTSEVQRHIISRSLLRDYER